jgi:hypothetical protein
MADPTNVINPGLVNVADEAYDGLPVDFRASNKFVLPASASPNNVAGDLSGNTEPIVVDQEITVTPSTSSGPSVAADSSGNTKPVLLDQEITVGPSQNAGTDINGGTFSPLSPNVLNTQQNSVVGQTFGSGTPTNVFP